jgi:small subunit ribosomal protein S6
MVQASTEAVRAREYETIYVVRPDVTIENAARIARRIEEVVSRERGKLTRVETWGRRQLAYAVGPHRRGVYVYVKYVGAGEIVTELERNLRMLDDVIKFITVQVRDEVDLENVQVDAETVRFDPIEIPTDEEPEPTLAETLGLVPSQHDRGEGRMGRDRYDDSGDDSMGLDDDDDEEPVSGMDKEEKP